MSVRARPLAAAVVASAPWIAGTAAADQPAYFSIDAALTAGSSLAYDQSGGAALLNPAGLAGGADTRIDASATYSSCGRFPSPDE